MMTPQMKVLSDLNWANGDLRCNLRSFSTTMFHNKG